MIAAGVGSREDLAARLCRALLDRRVPAGHWEGHLSSSALATATAVVALDAARRDREARDAPDRALAGRGVAWLLAHQNADGGWGDTPDSCSNISTTALAWAALACGSADAVESASARAVRWLTHAAGGSDPRSLAAALSDRYGEDRTFSVPILTMCAIAGRLGPCADAWRLIPQLPFELAVFPRRLFGALRLPVVSYALPALISMGLARHARGPRSTLLSPMRDRARRRVLDVLCGLQPRGGGFLEAIPLTSFVAMSLVAAGERAHPVVDRALDFLRRAVRADGSWAIDSNLATWVTTLSVNGLGAAGALGAMSETERVRVRDWLLAQQWRVEHPYTGAAPGGWAWTDLPGGVPDADDTAGALVALMHLDPDDEGVRRSAALGVRWLLDLQNRDGGIPTFCRGWGRLPFDRSASDLTSHAIRAWTAWRGTLELSLRARVDRATGRALSFLARHQRVDGAFIPLWFGNQRAAGEENPVLGTARVLRGLEAPGLRPDARVSAIAARAARWLVNAQNTDGGWGGGPDVPSSVEETAVALSGLVAGGIAVTDVQTRAAVERAAAWLGHALHAAPPAAAPIGLYFARLWYAEALYPLIFAVEAMSVVDGSRSPADRES